MTTGAKIREKRRILENELKLYMIENDVINHGKSRKITLPIKELIEYQINFPNCQRDIIEPHVDEIVQYQKSFFKNNSIYLIMGCIELCRLDGKLFCIDGQHRYHAFCKLFNEDNTNNFYVDIEIIECRDENEMVSFFKIINMNKPVPEFLKNYKPLIAVDLKKYINNTYSQYIKDSTRPIRPNINLIKFLENIQLRYGLLVENMKSSEELIEWFERTNKEHGEFLRTRDDDIVKNVISKIDATVGRLRNSQKLYLGSYWLETIPKKISAPTRKKVWKEFYDSLAEKDYEILCPCCETSYINPHEFDCGHIISFKNGGETCASNLRPICGLCNGSMGSMNWDEFKKTKL